MKKVILSLFSLCIALGFSGCSGTKGFLAEDDFSMTDPLLYKKRYTEGFLDMTIHRKGSLFPSYEISECHYTKQDLSNLVLPRNPYFADDDTVKVLGRDGEELGVYMLRFMENEISTIGIVSEGGKIKKTTAQARLVIPYQLQIKYLKIGRKKIEIPQ